MISISKDSALLTIISVFTVAAGKQDELLDLLSTNLVWLRKRDGFVSASLHVSGDGVNVVNYAQWASASSLEAALKDQNVRDHVAAVSKIATVKAMRCAVATSAEIERS